MELGASSPLLLGQVEVCQRSGGQSWCSGQAEGCRQLHQLHCSLGIPTAMAGGQEAVQQLLAAEHPTNEGCQWANPIWNMKALRCADRGIRLVCEDLRRNSVLGLKDQQHLPADRKTTWDRWRPGRDGPTGGLLTRPPGFCWPAGEEWWCVTGRRRSTPYWASHRTRSSRSERTQQKTPEPADANADRADASPGTQASTNRKVRSPSSDLWTVLLSGHQSEQLLHQVRFVIVTQTLYVCKTKAFFSKQKHWKAAKVHFRDESTFPNSGQHVQAAVGVQRLQQVLHSLRVGVVPLQSRHNQKVRRAETRWSISAVVGEHWPTGWSFCTTPEPRRCAPSYTTGWRSGRCRGRRWKKQRFGVDLQMFLFHRKPQEALAEELWRTSKYFAGRSLQEASSCLQLLIDSGLYIPAPDLCRLNTEAKKGPSATQVDYSDAKIQSCLLTILMALEKNRTGEEEQKQTQEKVRKRKWFLPLCLKEILLKKGEAPSSGSWQVRRFPSSSVSTSRRISVLLGPDEAGDRIKLVFVPTR